MALLNWMLGVIAAIHALIMGTVTQRWDMFVGLSTKIIVVASRSHRNARQLPTGRIAAAPQNWTREKLAAPDVLSVPSVRVAISASL